MSDYREDGMDLGSDSSRSSSESSSSKVTPCSECKSSPSLELATLEDYEEDEDFQEYKKKVMEEWESHAHARPANSGRGWGGGGPVGRGCGEEPVRPRPVEEELLGPRPAEEEEEEPQLPTMDWAALEKHLAGLQEVHNQNQNLGRSTYTCVSFPFQLPPPNRAAHR
ncbi:hypothetical protein COCON_G00184400 [Conger conger]|uniref:Uncharacterized protein n=1 Tax=Conger conger TaxID=82655 RepID=A0A9Q1D2Z1_CONCO|nr:hypothetical protein COCON_G00184400 [Conger conger]